MPHIALPEGIPGILGPMMFRPETAEPLNALAEVLLRGDNSLTRGERELIAAYVSGLNQCQFCHSSHSAFAALQLEGSWAVVDAVVLDKDTAPVSDKLSRCSPSPVKCSRGDSTSRNRLWPPPASRARPTSRSTTPC